LRRTISEHNRSAELKRRRDAVAVEAKELKGQLKDNNADESPAAVSDIDQVATDVAKWAKQADLGSRLLIDSLHFVALLFRVPCRKCLCVSKTLMSAATEGPKCVFHFQCMKCKNNSVESNMSSSTADFAKEFGLATIIGGNSVTKLLSTFYVLGLTNLHSETSIGRATNRVIDPLVTLKEWSQEKAAKAVFEYCRKWEMPCEASFDAAWRHVKNSGEADGEIIAHFMPPGYVRRPVIASFQADKARVQKDKDGKVTGLLRAGNHEGSSKTMEHHILEECHKKLGTLAEEHGVFLNIAIDGDLTSKDTLANVSYVLSIILDLSHKVKNVGVGVDRGSQGAEAAWLAEFRDYLQISLTAYVKAAEETGRSEEDLRHALNIAVCDHLLEGTTHEHCWKEVCIHKGNPVMEVPEPNLHGRPSEDQKKLLNLIQKVYKTELLQNLVSDIRTSHNEAFNRLKLKYLSKLLDFWKTHGARHGCAVVEQNHGFTELVSLARERCQLAPLSARDMHKIRKHEVEKEAGNEKYRGAMEEKIEKKRKKMQELRAEKANFSLDTEWVAYKSRQNEEEIRRLTLSSSWEQYYVAKDPDFTVHPKCIGCDMHSKVHTNGLCNNCQLAVEFKNAEMFPSDKIGVWERLVYGRGDDFRPRTPPNE
jgi:hypothetical protein